MMIKNGHWLFTGMTEIECADQRDDPEITDRDCRTILIEVRTV